ncbi:MAG: hypothetical protein ACM31O_18985 [Bacteroidota bacterium]|jgi:hypothetical protein
MGIESLNKAALAAGFAMVAPDDDSPIETRRPTPAPHPQARTQWRPFIGEVDHSVSVRRMIAAAVGWIRERWAPRGGRAPA